MFAEKKNDADQNRPSFASLTAGLLARKGEAHPAPAHLDGVSLHANGVSHPAKVSDAPQPPQTMTAPVTAPASPPAGQLSPSRAPAPAQAKAPVGTTANEAACCNWTLPASALKPLPPGQRHSAGLRLDDARLRKVKILAARAGVSNQKVLLAALDHYLDHMVVTLARECPCLARSIDDLS